MVYRLTLAVSTFLVLAVCGGLVGSALLRKQADFIVQTVHELSQKQQPPTVADLRERFGHRLKQDQCVSSSDCGYEVAVSNRILASVHLVPYSEIRTHFWTRGGIVLGSLTDFTINPHRDYSVVAHVQIDFCNGCQMFTIDPWYSSALKTNGLVEIGSQASAANKQTAFSLDTNCLIKLGGCDSVADLLPTVWKAEGDKVLCTVQNDRGFVK